VKRNVQANSILCQWTASLLLICLPGNLMSQSGPHAPPANRPIPPPPTAQPKDAPSAPPAAPIRNTDRRRAAKLFLTASKLFEAAHFEAAMHDYELAAKLDPSNSHYPLAASLARSHAVTALIQAAAKDRIQGDDSAARAALAHGLELDPTDPKLIEHLREMGDEAIEGLPRPLYEPGASVVGPPPVLAPNSGVRSFHLHADTHQVIRQVYTAFGIQATTDSSVSSKDIRMDVDNADFATAARILGMLTDSFYVPLDAHQVLVARESKANRDQFMRQDMETFFLSGLSETELKDMATLAKNAFGAHDATADFRSGTITIRSTPDVLSSFKATVQQLVEGHNQVYLEARLIQIAHTSSRNTGVQPMQTMTAINIYTEEQSILNANQSLVQQIISSGLAKAGDIPAILGILLASGQVSSSLLSNGVALFGGGLTASALSPGPVTANLNLNSSDSRELDVIHMRVGDGEKATLRSGTRYPIQTSSFSSLGASIPTIPGLNGAGNSSALSSLISSYANSVPNVPQVEYQDLGMTMTATPKIMRNDNVALTIDLKIDALSGGSVNGNPILDTRSYSGVVTLKEGEAIEVVSELDKSQSRAISGTPGISEIPGLNDLTDKDIEKNYATLLVVITAHVIRGTQPAGRSPMYRLEQSQQAH